MEVAPIIREYHTTYMYKGERRPRVKRVKRQYEKSGRPHGTTKFNPSPEVVAQVKAAHETKTIKTIALELNLKEHEVSTILYRRRFA